MQGEDSVGMYKSEMDRLGETYKRALEYDLDRLKWAISSTAEASIIGVGSGGSYTVASLLCNLHEAFTGRVSRASTPLEIICNPGLAANSPVFLISAEGKNPDIIEAFLRARQHSSRTIHVISNRSTCPLIEEVSKQEGVSNHVFELERKDGYLATNSLLLDSIIIARAYAELDGDKRQFPHAISELQLEGESIDGWLAASKGFAKEVAKRNLIVVFSPLLKPIATDLESKVAEAALAHCQLADIRSFAHGRHLWLANRPEDCAILALVDPSLKSLWSQMRSRIPSDIPVRELVTLGVAPWDLIAGLTAQMQFVGLVAEALGKDPGRPEVPLFGRQLYYEDLKATIPAPKANSQGLTTSKCEVLGAKWPSTIRPSRLMRSFEAYRGAFQNHIFKAVVFDYDGTLCSSQRSHSDPQIEVVNALVGLAEHGVTIGIASGRGGSVQESLYKLIPRELHERFLLGLYNGGYIGPLSQEVLRSSEGSEFLNHVVRVANNLKEQGVPIVTIRKTPPYQVSIRFREGISTDHMWFVIADALRQAGLDFTRIVRSKHSVDILGKGVNKSHVIGAIIDRCKLSPYEVLTMGDQGAWPGNDFALLEHKYSLSVDEPSRRIDRGWKLAPKHKRDVDATLWYLGRVKKSEPGQFTIDFTSEVAE